MVSHSYGSRDTSPSKNTKKDDKVQVGNVGSIAQVWVLGYCGNPDAQERFPYNGDQTKNAASDVCWRNVKKKSHVNTFHGKYPLYRSDAFSAVFYNSLETMKHIIKMNVCWKGPFVRKWNENRF